MQSKTSFFNRAIYKKNISRTWIVGLLYLILLILIIPVIFVINSANFTDSWYYSMGYSMDMLLFEYMSSVPTSGLAMMVAIIVTAITFWYLFNKRDNYMIHAFPVSRKSLYCTGAMSSLAVQIVPIVITSVVMSIIAMTSGVHQMGCIWYWALIMIVSALLFTSIAVFSLMTSGQLVTGIVFYFIFNFLYLMIEVAFRMTSSLLMFGMSYAMSGIDYTPWTPVQFIQQNVRLYLATVYSANGDKIENFITLYQGGRYLAIYAVVAVFIMILAYVMYHFKKLETVQDFIAVLCIKPIFTIGMSFFISMVVGALVAGMIDSVKIQTYSGRFALAIVVALLIGIVIFFATQMLIEKTLRVFSLRKLTQCGIYTVGALVVLLCIRFDVMGYEDRVPDLEDCQWAAINNEYTMVFTDPDDISSVIDLHKNFLADKKELRDVNVTYGGMPSSTLTLKYKLKNGHVLIRSYSVVDTSDDQVSAQYVAATEPILDFINTPEHIKEHIIGNIWNDCKVKEMSFSTYTYNDSDNEFDVDYNSFDYLSSIDKEAKYDNVYQALLKDIDEGKVFVQSFGYTYDYESEELYNELYFTIANDRVRYFSDNETYWDYQSDYDYPMYEQSISVTLTRDCTHTLQALKDEGFYTDDEELVTYAEYNEKMGYYDDLYY